MHVLNLILELVFYYLKKVRSNSGKNSNFEGAAFTRFQTLRLQRAFPNLADKLISYGSCQFPTLGRIFN
jgi:hypothetical protein